MRERLSTGIRILDRKLDGGIPEGSLVLLSAPPDSQSEQFLYELTTARPTLYLTTERQPVAVRSAIDAEGGSTDNAEVYHVDGDDPVEETRRTVERAPDGTNVVVDVVDTLERAGDDRYRDLLVALQNRVRSAGGFAMLHGLDGRRVPDNRDRTEYMADAVFELRTRLRGERIENRLVVAKFRGGRPFEEALKLELVERVAIDTSRDIA